MIELIHRRALGFKDDFEGYVFLKESDQERPVLQLHLYPYDSGKNYLHTLFWLGQTTFEQISQCLIDTIREIAETKSVSLSELSKGSVHFARRNSFASARFEVVLPEDEASEGAGSVRIEADHVPQDSGTISFVRFDMKNDAGLRIILCADLHGGHTSEVGFSFSNMDVPAPILSLFQNTCREEISKQELEEIQTNIWDHSKVPAEID